MSTETQSHIFNFSNTYTALPDLFYSKVLPYKYKCPKIEIFNKRLARELGLITEGISKEELVNILSGRILPEGSEPIAQAYAGHQFGHFTMLGDGRAILLGEHQSDTLGKVDIQLKSAGQTPYSRSGDGKGTLYSMLREYLISEAMHHLNIPTTRSLAVLSTGEEVYRHAAHNGGLLVRVASSHIRVGTFEYASRFVGKEGLKALADYTIDRHFPDIATKEKPYVALIKAMIDRQTDLIVDWMRVGFIHGVMNTDNMTLSGETIDYGPCAFMNTYDPATVFSSIDAQGRYAFGNQGNIGYWNLAVFANALLPLIDEDSDKAVDVAKAILQTYPETFSRKWLHMMGAKLGFIYGEPEDEDIIKSLLEWMHKYKADYTNTFLEIMGIKTPDHQQYDQPEFKLWLTKHRDRLDKSNADGQQLMADTNPLYIPRNHIVEQVLNAAAIDGDFTQWHTFMEILETPYTLKADTSSYLTVPSGVDEEYQTYCGT